MVAAKCTTGQRWDDNCLHCPLPLKWPRLLLYQFPTECWRPSALQVSTLTSKQPLILQAHRELLHGCLLILCQLDKSECDEFQSMGSFHMLFDNALSGKCVRTTRLSVTSTIGHGNFVSFSGVLIRYCSIMPSRGGRLWTHASGHLQSTLSSEVDMEIMDTLLRLGLKIYFLTK